MKLAAAILTDFYKTGHKFQFPAGTEYVYSNSTCRSDHHAKNLPDFDHKIVNFGLQSLCQYFLIDLWNETFFNRPKEEAVGEYKRIVGTGLNDPDTDVTHMEELHDLGYLPISIKALPEGARVDIRVASYTIVNTDPRFGWVTNYLETPLQSNHWKPIVAATTAYEFRRLFEKMAEETGADPSFIPWQGHDFSMRGLSGFYDSAAVGAAHLLSFTGTDTLPAIYFLEEYYSGRETFIGGSVPATEHAVMCMGEEDNEIGTYIRLISEVYPSGVVSIVSDTWDFWRVVTEYTDQLKNMIMARDGKVVLRPDSGDPVEIICGTVKDFSTQPTLEHALTKVLKHNEDVWDYPSADEELITVFTYEGRYFAHNTETDYESVKTKNIEEFELLEDYEWDEIVPTPEMKGAVECLWEIFGGTTSSKGFRTLDKHIGLIYGDSINLDRAKRILEGLKAKGFASDNIVFGVGSFTYQYVTRDTYGQAVKATFGVVNGKPREIAKNPKTDSGSKKSAKGLIRIEYENGHYVQYDQQTPEQEKMGELKEIFRDGKMVSTTTLVEIRDRLHKKETT